MLNENISTVLDFIRGLSAILVVMEHLSSRLFVGYGNVDNPTIFTNFLYLLNILGGPSVIIFFVLSGLFISRSIYKAIHENRWSWKEYLINRLTRLYIVLIPALVLTFILDRIAVIYFGDTGYTSALANIKAFIGNLFFLQNIYVPVYGSNAPLWSLNYEFWYYMLFPVLFLLLVNNKGKVIKAIYLLISCVIISTVGLRMNLYFFIWLIGAIVFVLPKIHLLNKRFMPIIALLILLVAMVIRPLVMTGRLFTNTWTEDLFFVDLFLALAVGLFIYTLFHALPDKFKTIDLSSFGEFSKLIASFSFSLYIIHYPIINTVYYWGASNGFSGLQPNLSAIIIEFILVAIICVLAYLFSRMTESKTELIRNFIQEKALRKKIIYDQKTVNKHAG